MSADSARGAWLITALAALSFVPGLFLYYVGEEGLYTIAAMAMQSGGDLLVPVVPGGNYGRPPLLIWAIVLAAKAVGWDNVLVASRLVTMAATVLTALAAAWFAQALFAERRLAALAAMAYLTSLDILLYRGWLAYSDPAFGLLVFGAIACAWIAAKRAAYALLVAALLLLTCAFLTKAFTAYAFYGVAVLVLLARAEYRRFFLRVPSVLLHAVAAAFPFAWFAVVPGSSAQSVSMLDEVSRRFVAAFSAAYLGDVLAYPALVLAYLSPPLALALVHEWRSGFAATRSAPSDLRLAGWIALICVLPYWLTPHNHTRYLLPLYPLAAVACAWLACNSRAWLAQWMVRGALAAVVLKFVLVAGYFPWYQKHFRGENYYAAAKDIIAVTAGHALYTTDASASGAAVVGHIDSLRFPAAPLPAPPAGFDSGYVIAYAPDEKLGQVFKRYELGANELYLLCRGAACAARH